MVYNQVEKKNRTELRELQRERLQDTVSRVYNNVSFYREKLTEAGIEPADIQTLEDIEKLPMTTKEDLRDEYPDGLFAVDTGLLRLHASSGTTGKPKIVGYTEKDLSTWSKVMARSLTAAGVEPGDMVQNSYGYGLFTGGMGFQQGAEELGATVLPTGTGGTHRQVELANDLGSDVLACTPSYSLYFAEKAIEMGFDPQDFDVSTVIYGAENCTDPMREAIEKRLNVTAVDIYGLSEIIGPGVAIECNEAQDGLHIWEDQFYPEVIDPDTGETVEPGEEGELVLTPLTKEAIPLLRYRTGDLTALNYEKCECGRTMVRMDSVTGRADDLIIIRGINMYPSEIEHAVLDIDGVAPHYRVDIERKDNLDWMKLTVEQTKVTTKNKETLQEELTERLSNVLTFTPDSIEVLDYQTLERQTTGKAQYIYDHRD
jgi:phenylacetate-CoA ligase